MKNRYEVMYILRTDDENGDYSKQVEEYKDLVESVGGEVDNIDEWGVRNLSYEINDQNEGYYVLMDFTYQVDNIPQLEDKLKLDDKILRHLVVKKD